MQSLFFHSDWKRHCFTTTTTNTTPPVSHHTDCGRGVGFDVFVYLSLLNKSNSFKNRWVTGPLVYFIVLPPWQFDYNFSPPLFIKPHFIVTHSSPADFFEAMLSLSVMLATTCAFLGEFILIDGDDNTHYNMMHVHSTSSTHVQK